MAQTSSTDAITLPWTERKPFQFIDTDGKLKGLLFELGQSIFAEAGVPMKWVNVPALRIGRTMAMDNERICLVGWFRTPEREKIAKISLPIYRDHPQVGVARADSHLNGERSLSSVMEDNSVRLIVKQGYSYGVYLDALIAARKNEGVANVVGDHARILTMLQWGRADLIFLTQEEVDYYSAENHHFTDEFKVISFKDMPAGNQRHIICSKQVSDATMDKLNAAIRSAMKITAN
jgi:polar amino acid transport system substrate-binding protein